MSTNIRNRTPIPRSFSQQPSHYRLRKLSGLSLERKTSLIRANNLLGPVLCCFIAALQWAWQPRPSYGMHVAWCFSRVLLKVNARWSVGKTE
jgi:hypothetical protein